MFFLPSFGPTRQAMARLEFLLLHPHTLQHRRATRRRPQVIVLLQSATARPRQATAPLPLCIAQRAHNLEAAQLQNNTLQHPLHPQQATVPRLRCIVQQAPSAATLQLRPTLAHHLPPQARRLTQRLLQNGRPLLLLTPPPLLAVDMTKAPPGTSDCDPNTMFFPLNLVFQQHALMDESISTCLLHLYYYA